MNNDDNIKKIVAYRRQNKKVWDKKQNDKIIIIIKCRTDMNELIDEMMIDSFEWIKQNETKKIMSKMWKQWIELNWMNVRIIIIIIILVQMD